MSFYVQGDNMAIDPVISWPKSVCLEIKRALVRLAELECNQKWMDAVQQYQIAHVRDDFMLYEAVVHRMKAERIGAYFVPDQIALSPALTSVGSPFRRRLFRGDDEEELRVNKPVPCGTFRVQVDGSPIFVVFDLTFNGSSIEDKALLAYRDEKQVEQFVARYQEIVRSIVRNEDFIYDLVTSRSIPKPQIRMNDVFLPPGMKEDLIANTVGFFSMRSAYQRLNVPWKRGIVLAGEPGNGKTMFLKALSTIVKHPFCILRFDSREEDHDVRGLFQKAVDIAPCTVIIEDLDRAVEARFNLSTLLNVLDGIEEADGILTIATTNRPEKIDPALLARPSRFDRKYIFEMPGRAERLSLLKCLSRGVFSDHALERAGGHSDGFSMASVKETVLSALIRAAAHGRKPDDSDLKDALKIMRSETEKAKRGLERHRKPGFGPDGDAQEFMELPMPARRWKPRSRVKPKW